MSLEEFSESVPDMHCSKKWEYQEKGNYMGGMKNTEKRFWALRKYIRLITNNYREDKDKGC